MGRRRRARCYWRRGSNLTVDADYIHESIVNPGAKVVKGFASIMPGDYGDTLK